MRKYIRRKDIFVAISDRSYAIMAKNINWVDLKLVKTHISYDNYSTFKRLDKGSGSTRPST